MHKIKNNVFNIIFLRSKYFREKVLPNNNNNIISACESTITFK